MLHELLNLLILATCPCLHLLRKWINAIRGPGEYGLNSRSQHKEYPGLASFCLRPRNFVFVFDSVYWRLLVELQGCFSSLNCRLVLISRLRTLFRLSSTASALEVTLLLGGRLKVLNTNHRNAESKLVVQCITHIVPSGLHTPLRWLLMIGLQAPV